MRQFPDPRQKILDAETLLLRLASHRPQRVVFTNGCFDILHRGHVEYLYAARELGDALVVGLNSDASVRRLKGPTRPINPEQDRAIVLAGLAAVDAVTIFSEDTPRELIRAIVPGVLVKGGDYDPDTIVGAREVREAGGRVVVVPLIPGRSTTTILERVLHDDQR